MSVAEPLSWSSPVSALRGVGAERTAQLARLGVHTAGDLLLLRPRRYEDRRQVRSVAELRQGEPALVRGRVVALGVKYRRRRTESVFELIVDDGHRRLYCRWWNQPFLEGRFQRGEEVLVYGKVTSLRPPVMDHPETEPLQGRAEDSIHVGRIVPLYPLTEGLPQRWLRALVWRALELLPAGEPDRWGTVEGFLSRAEAVRQLHFPPTPEASEQARQRLALEELAVFQTEVLQRRQRLLARASGLACAGDNHLIRPFLKRLDFQLTEAQARVLREIRADLGAGRPMRRLLQGDVGSGKTVVAACAALMTLESGHAVALMAPTEILAEQHYRTFHRWFTPLDVPVRLRTGGRPTADAPGPGHPPGVPVMTIGTHALITHDFAPESLGLVILDEQHRFGVAQREALVRKGGCPHALVMTATPIPRTLGLTLYGDLDVSVIEVPPPGRGPVRTFIRAETNLPRVWAFVRTQLEAGRQVYAVYPRIDESEDQGLKAVRREADRLGRILRPHSVGLLHGRMLAEEAEAVMQRFRAQELGVLVATSVIEVGLDVPNATVMVIEGAEQFGLAQLHQLRGRIGRGGHASWCLLVANLRTPQARERLRVLESTCDGFAVAEADLRLRGPGELLGRQQSGLPSFRFAELERDLALVERARALVVQGGQAG